MIKLVIQRFKVIFMLNSDEKLSETFSTLFHMKIKSKIA